VKAWSSRLRCRVPSLFGELQVRRLLSDLDAAGCWLGGLRMAIFRIARLPARDAVIGVSA
jgi:hypothetical protein